MDQVCYGAAGKGRRRSLPRPRWEARAAVGRSGAGLCER